MPKRSAATGTGFCSRRADAQFLPRLPPSALEDGGFLARYVETISDTLESCGCACESLASLTDTRRWELELADDGEWAQKMSSECEQLTAKWFPHLPGNVMGAHINVLRTHIRAVELLFCREDATEDEKMIQRVLNTLAKAAYVAMWTEGTDAE